MILDNIKNAHLYEGLNPLIKEGLAYLKTLDTSNLVSGKITLPNGIFAITQIFMPKSTGEAKLETHQKYIDIQYLIEGVEIIEYAPFEKLEISNPYHQENDITFYHNSKNVIYLNLKAEEFTIFYPHDAHKPGIGSSNGLLIKKIVIKIPVK
jgi:YhcH/YjgK/YiaL family protein